MLSGPAGAGPDLERPGRPGLTPSGDTPTQLTYEEFCGVLADGLGREPWSAEHDQHLARDLGFDSLERYEFHVLLEELAGAPLPGDLLDGIGTMRDAYDWYLVKVDQRPAASGEGRIPPSLPPGEVLMETRRVALRAVVPPDYEWLYELTTRSDNLVRWRDRGQTFRIDEWEARLWAGVEAQFVAVARESGAPIGLVTLYNHQARNRHARIAAIFDERTSSAGWRLEGVGLLVNYAFEVFDLNKVYAEVVAFNFAAFASGEGRFFVQEGLLTDHEYAHGRWWGVHVLSIDRSRFLELREVWLPRSLGSAFARAS